MNINLGVLETAFHEWHSPARSDALWSIIKLHAQTMAVLIDLYYDLTRDRGSA